MKRIRVSLVVITFIFLFLPTRPPVAARMSLQEGNSVLSTVEQIQEDFQNVPCRNKDRQAGVRGLFEKMGAGPDALVVEKRSGVENLVLRHAGPSNEIIVIGAHYDFIDSGCGAVDNWSGIVTLAHLYRSIRKLPSHKTILFVAFGSEEKGLLGSRAMADAIPKNQVPEYCAMVNMDSFGLARPFAMENTSDNSLITLARAIAEEMQIPFYTVPIQQGDSDSSSFRAKKIPAITLSGLSNEWQSILHSKNDQASKVLPVSAYLGYRLALTMWSKIDVAPCQTYRAGPIKPPPSLKK